VAGAARHARRRDRREHEAASKQPLIVLSGRVVCAAPEEHAELEAGEAVEWQDGEWHETRSLEPTRLLIVEGHWE
jgi:mannose-6-phosphate isomerase-like protein (cupin superfamily)